MRLSRVALVLGALVLPFAAAVALAGNLAGNVELEGKLLNAPIPQGYNITGGDLYFHQGKAFVEVRGEGDCHYEWHQECDMVGNPPHYVCHQVPQWTCMQDRTEFAMPASLSLRNKDVFFTGPAQGDVKIGEVRSFLFWTWIKLGDHARLVVTGSTAKLAIDLGGAPRADRQDIFARLYGEPVVDLLVKFRNVGNAEARGLLRTAGYEGEVAGSNDWSERDLTHDEIGVRMPVRQAAALIAKLKQNPRIAGVRPAGTAAGE